VSARDSELPNASMLFNARPYKASSGGHGPCRIVYTIYRIPGHINEGIAAAGVVVVVHGEQRAEYGDLGDLRS
jgi:hypothetical protein